MLPWKLRKHQILPVSQNLSSVYFSPAKFQLVSCNLSLAIIRQMTYTRKLPKLCHLKQTRLPPRGRPIFLITRIIIDRIGLHSVLFPLQLIIMIIIIIIIIIIITTIIIIIIIIMMMVMMMMMIAFIRKLPVQLVKGSKILVMKSKTWRFTQYFAA